MHWSDDTVDMGHFGVSFLEILILFEQWACHRLLSEKVTRPHVRANRPISMSAAELLDGTLKQCYSASIFTIRFPHWSWNTH